MPNGLQITIRRKCGQVLRRQIAEGDRIRDKWMEITADRTTHKFVSRGELPFTIHVTGTLSVRFYDSCGKLLQDYPATPLNGMPLNLT